MVKYHLEVFRPPFLPPLFANPKTQNAQKNFLSAIAQSAIAYPQIIHSSIFFHSHISYAKHAKLWCFFKFRKGQTGRSPPAELGGFLLN
jgi:hypothetical protein